MLRDENIKLVRHFSRLMRRGKVKSALRLLLKREGMVVAVSSPAGDGDAQAVFDVLKEKHPRKALVSSDAIVDDEGKVFHPVIFDSIDGVPYSRPLFTPMELLAHQDWMQVLEKECAPHSNTTLSPCVTVYHWLQRRSAQGTVRDTDNLTCSAAYRTDYPLASALHSVHGCAESLHAISQFHVDFAQVDP